MKRIKRIMYMAEQRALMWDRYQQGQINLLMRTKLFSNTAITDYSYLCDKNK